jgi:beta-glucosidase
VTLSLDRRALSCWDPTAHAWVVPLGEREILVGHSSRDIRSRARFRLVDE